MLKQFLNFAVVIFSIIMIFYSEKLFCAGNNQPLNTRDFYKQIYNNVCPSGEMSCLREIITSSFQLSLPRNRGGKVGSNIKHLT